MCLFNRKIQVMPYTLGFDTYKNITDFCVILGIAFVTVNKTLTITMWTFRHARDILGFVAMTFLVVVLLSYGKLLLSPEHWLAVAL